MLIGEDCEILLMDGLDSALIGYCEQSTRCIYSSTKIIEELIRQGMNEDDAIEYYQYNIATAYVGEKTPIICNDGMQYL